jgi:hypothetical protein
VGATMKAKLLGLLAFVSLSGLSSAQALTYTYDVDYAINSTTVTGDILLNCDSCNVTSLTLVSWSLLSGSGTSATFTGSDLSASPSSITFTPTASTDTIFNGSSGGLFFGSTTQVPGGTSSCTPGSPGCESNGEANPCAAVSGAGGYGACAFGTLSLASTETPLVIATAVTPLPGALPLLGTGLAALGLCWRRKGKAQAVAA